MINIANCESDLLLKSSISSGLPKATGTSVTESRILEPPPPPNFLTSVPNALGVAGLGLLWIKEITTAIGTPILIPILVPLLFALVISLMFIPDFTSIGYNNFIEAAVAMLPKFW
ncbi:unnamed protein product [Orchesella dallaii]|uniref:Uncharacterized protein n=1 Tax=Orchesella dallaii TaxID=48710 RepID=A0ABP1R852_9HEXA